MKIIIVDNHYQQIGLKERDTVTDEDIFRVAGLWVINSKNEVLIAQRKWTKKAHPGRWSAAVGGTVEENETYESNIYREAEEEIGLSGLRLTEWFKKLYTGKHQHFTQWYRAVVDWPIQKFVIQKDEVEAIRWVSRDELRNDVVANPNKYVPSMRELTERSL